MRTPENTFLAHLVTIDAFAYVSGMLEVGDIHLAQACTWAEMTSEVRRLSGLWVHSLTPTVLIGFEFTFSDGSSYDLQLPIETVTEEHFDLVQFLILQIAAEAQRQPMTAELHHLLEFCEIPRLPVAAEDLE